MIKEPTRVTKTSKTIIDNIFVNIDNYYEEILISALSDHYAQKKSFEILNNSPDKPKIEKKNHKTWTFTFDWHGVDDGWLVYCYAVRVLQVTREWILVNYLKELSKFDQENNNWWSDLQRKCEPNLLRILMLFRFPNSD